ncbi:Tumor necrosis factor receptor super, member 12a [Branchiostoma belcheri]|nr:Tumor necrosis factor receptor super, member 12a [Branchiostoma belcheri]
MRRRVSNAQMYLGPMLKSRVLRPQRSISAFGRRPNSPRARLPRSSNLDRRAKGSCRPKNEFGIQGGRHSGLPTAGPETFCGEGQVWDDTLRSCVSCSICKTFPDTPHCGLCQETATSSHNLPSEVTQTPCTQGSVWDSFQNGCVSCAVCETHPDTPICTACSSQQDSPRCPKGLAWDPFLENCMSCTICETHPDSYICQVCPTVQPTVTPDPRDHGQPSDDPGLVTIILAAVLACVGVFVLVLLAAAIVAKCVPVRYRRCPQCCQKEPKGDETNNGKRIAQPTGQQDSGRSSLVSSRSDSDTCVMEPLKPQDNTVNFTSGLQLPPCPHGAAWDGFLGKCVDCAVCETHPDTPVCRVCPTVSPRPVLRTEAPDGLKSDASPALVAVLTSVAVCLTAGLVGVAVWVKYGPGWGVCRCCGHGQKGRKFPEVEPGKTARGYKVTQVENDSGCKLRPQQQDNNNIDLWLSDPP